MRLSDDFEETDHVKAGLGLGGMIAGVLTFMVLLVVCVLIVNRSKFNTKPAPVAEQTTEETEIPDSEKEYEIGESDLTASDLDFWNMYKTEPVYDKSLDEAGKKYAENAEKVAEEDALRAAEEDPSEGGTKTEVILPDGGSQWIMINAYIKKNDYDYTGLVSEDPLMRYYKDAKKVSRQGMILTEDQAAVELSESKEAGIDFIIARIGYRGYTDGEIVMDGQGSIYCEEATAIGMDYGLTFVSSAVTMDEAKEEAAQVLAYITEYGLDPEYPILLQMEATQMDKSRTNDLTKNQLTENAVAFCTEIRNAGYTPVICASKYWLLRKLDLLQLTTFDIALNQEKDTPDYPYEFTMWEYKSDAKIDGIPKETSMIMSFVDYAMR
ncbi:MAG: hypothetical protein K6G07_07170 [Lachnospiraceae bacterium]|nr:hypothetical protein [Lachnospiraceae bacterium]